MERYGESYFYKMLNPMDCDVCGRQIYAETPLHQCLFCSKILCPTCNTYGLCPEHYEKLTTEQKHCLILISQKQSHRIFMRFTILILIIFLVFVSVLTLMFTKNNDITFQFGFGMIMGVILLGSLVTFLYFHIIIKREHVEKVCHLK